MRTKALSAVLCSTALLASACGGGGPQGASGAGGLSDGKVVFGVLNDQSGAYSQLSGKNSVSAVELAIEDYKTKYGDKAVVKEFGVESVDHQNKPDVANAKAAELYDRKAVDVILDVPTSSAALKVADVAKEKKKLYFNISAATTDLTGKACNKYTFHYAYDTYMLANGTGRNTTEQGKKNWYIVYPDYAFGQDMEKSFSAAVTDAGGTIVSRDAAPFPNTSGDFSTYLLKAPTLTPKPDVLGTMQAGAELVALVKQYNEFKLRDKGVGLAVGLMFLTDIHSLTPAALAGTTYTDAWYWNYDLVNREFADRFKKVTGARPTFAHAANYSAALQYLEAVQSAGTDGSDAVVAQLEGKTVSDVFLRNGKIRAEDHRVVHDAYLAQVKQPSEVTEDWDYVKILLTIPAEKAFRAPSPDCKLS
ncbi:ABC transporter substrate-binding protein [Catellatospora bangladeshensis]|uniref:ABC transporter permease n=1 Tax=Catellatospora bangladeshensis TaxID=310355 RepID=A0A8J3JNR1_9ACTN|nr:ABC transporter substrate-binding protein [Catellatospora bangladeshensis]GIF83933.1 ABC transporter permease [Catellatospora bangladeshensis]